MWTSRGRIISITPYVGNSRVSSTISCANSSLLYTNRRFFIPWIIPRIATCSWKLAFHMADEQFLLQKSLPGNYCFLPEANSQLSFLPRISDDPHENDKEVSTSGSSRFFANTQTSVSSAFRNNYVLIAQLFTFQSLFHYFVRYV